MTTTTPTITTRVSDAGARVRPATSAGRKLGGRLVAAVSRFAVRGQLGSDAERDLGRRTGARV